MSTGFELVGLQAFACVFVEGLPGTPEAFTEAERAVAHLAVIRGQQMLGRLSMKHSPNRFLQCSFFNTVRSVTINPGFIPPPTDTHHDAELRKSEIQTREGFWLLPTLEALGHPATGGLSTADALAQFNATLATRDWSVPDKPRRGGTIFFTKFPTGWMAYANMERATIQWDWIADTSGDFSGTGAAGHGLENLDRVVAHELGHMFGGLDEYAEACNPNDMSGPIPTANPNCERNNPASVPCLMKGNDEALCGSSVEHFGWIDADLDGFVDAARPVAVKLRPFSGHAGDVVTITGTGLGEARSVTFTAIGGADFRIISDKELQVTVPEGSGDNVDVFVRTPLGITAPNLDATFSYL